MKVSPKNFLFPNIYLTLKEQHHTVDGKVDGRHFLLWYNMFIILVWAKNSLGRRRQQLKCFHIEVKRSNQPAGLISFLLSASVNNDIISCFTGSRTAAQQRVQPSQKRFGVWRHCWVRFDFYNNNTNNNNNNNNNKNNNTFYLECTFHLIQMLKCYKDKSIKTKQTIRQQ